MASCPGKKKGGFGPPGGERSFGKAGMAHAAQKKVGFPDGTGKADEGASAIVLLDYGPKSSGCRGPHGHVRVLSLRWDGFPWDGVA